MRRCVPPRLASQPKDLRPTTEVEDEQELSKEEGGGGTGGTPPETRMELDAEGEVLRELEEATKKVAEAGPEPDIDADTFEANWDENIGFSPNEPPLLSAKGPAGWNPEDYVDMEFDRMGLPSGGPSALPSSWGAKDGIQHPALGVFWPHKALDAHRRRPFAAPVDNTLPQEERSRQLQGNRTRLQTLWQFSNSHGVSWDDLDAAYGEWSDAGKARYQRWMSYKTSTRAKADHMAWFYLKRRYPGSDPRIVRPGAMNRTQARLYFAWKKHYLRMHRPGRLSEYLRQFVAGKMMRRETNDRVLGLVSPPAKV